MTRRTAEKCPLTVEWARSGTGPMKVRGAAYRLVTLPEGAENRHGPITRHTPAWARIDYELLANCVTMERPRQAGHEIEGRVRIKGKSYSAFTAAPDGNSPGMIIVRTKGKGR